MKNTPLDDAEGLILRKHVEIGYRIAQASVEFAHLADIIIYHHEWWNGRGYPQGLKEEDIPLMSRIISFRRFNVMTREQQNKPAMTKKALQKFSQSRSEFDPLWFKLFIR